METAVFWAAWGIISFWALKTFYYSFNKHKLESLRKAALGINLAVLILTFLPWVSLSLSGKSGFAIAMEGNILAALFLIILIASIVLLLTKSQPNLKIASVGVIINTFTLFGLMVQIRPGTFTLTLFDIAPIIVFVFLLVCNVVVLLLWQQLQLGKNKKLNLKEVQKFKKEVEKNGRSKFDLTIATEPTREDSFYLIQVSEIFPEHRTTFRWYRYYPDTRKVFTQFLERATTDNWDEVME